MSSLEPASSFAVAIAELLAAASFSVPHSPLGSAVDTAIPTSMGLCKTLVHSSGVKLCLFAMAVPSSALKGVNGLRQLSATTAMNACSIASYVLGTKTLRRAKKQKPKFSPRCATRRACPWFPLANSSNQQELELFQKDWGEHSPKGAYNPGEYIIT